jgi:tRNA threonylcarbamoyladenosine biosynthesis protein TsaB
MGAEPGASGGGASDGGPLVVAWDTCTLRGVLAIGSSGSLLAEDYFEAVKGHTGWLMPQLDSALRDLALSPAAIDYVAAGIGPGTFTGVKVGVACAKAVSMALGVPLVGMSTLDVLAAGAPCHADAVLATIDARRGQLYAAAYRRHGGALVRATDYICATPGEVALAVGRLGFDELAVVGEAPGDLALAMGGRRVDWTAEERYPVGEALLLRASELVARGEGSDPVSISPIYLKKPT